MNTPYNTGKVQIGRMHKPQPLPTLDADGLVLQRALIGKPQPFDWQDTVVITGCLIASAALLWILA